MKKHIKKTLAFIMICGTLLSVSACAKTETQAEPKTKTSQETEEKTDFEKDLTASAFYRQFVSDNKQTVEGSAPDIYYNATDNSVYVVRHEISEYFVQATNTDEKAAELWNKMTATFAELSKADAEMFSLNGYPVNVVYQFVSSDDPDILLFTAKNGEILYQYNK